MRLECAAGRVDATGRILVTILWWIDVGDELSGKDPSPSAIQITLDNLNESVQIHRLGQVVKAASLDGSGDAHFVIND